MKKHTIFSFLVLLFFIPSISSAAVINVINLNGSGGVVIGSLRWAINEANAMPGSDIINVTLSGTITLSASLPVITGDLVINGNNITIDGNGTYAAFSIQDNINDPEINVTINDLNIINCNGSNGPALSVYTRGSVVVVNNVNFSNNSSTGKGGAVWSTGLLTINDSNFEFNKANDDGGAILANGDEGNLIISTCTLHDNQSYNDQGGAISIENGGRAIISMSDFESNEAGDDGGAINVSDGVVEIYQSLFYLNKCDDSGGAIKHNDGTLTMENCTLSENEAGGRGGAMRITGEAANLSSMTIFNNFGQSRGGGITINSGTTLSVSNSIIAMNTSNSIGQDVYSEGTLNSLGFNIVYMDDQNHFTPMPSDMEGTDPMLAGLSNNGGITRTHGLLPGSPAVDNGGNCLAVDQRDFPRAAVNCSIGAFEGQLAPIPTFSQWGIIVLTLLLLVLSTLGIYSINRPVPEIIKQRRN